MGFKIDLFYVDETFTCLKQSILNYILNFIMNDSQPLYITIIAILPSSKCYLTDFDTKEENAIPAIYLQNYFL